VIEASLGEFNDDTTRHWVTREVTQKLELMRLRMEVDGFQVVCDKANNPPSIVENCDLQVDVYWSVGKESYHLTRRASFIVQAV
jgi:hypothetical protein